MARLGEVIDGKYEILREIGRGGMSVVYLAMDKRLNKQWAVKEFRKDKDDESKQMALKALLDEANLMKKLDHPTLPRIVDIIDNNRSVYIVMDYIEGESLNKVLESSGAQPQEAVIEWGKQLSEVLDYLHTRTPPIIYRDMKPANIMLKPDGTVRLIDFGIAREYKADKDSDTTNIGTRGYAAPEQFGEKGQTDARTDIYSLGVTLYHLVTGKNPAEPPYELYPIRHWNPKLSSGLEWLIQKCTQLNPKDRYQSCAEVTYVLEHLDKFEKEYKKSLRSKMNLFLAFVILAGVFLAAGGGSLAAGSYAQSRDYDNWMQQNTLYGYEQAIQCDEERPEAYVQLAEQLRAQVTAIYPGQRPDTQPQGTAEGGKDDGAQNSVMAAVTGGEIYQQEIAACFSEERLGVLYASDIQAYIKVNYELGRLFWNYYQGTALEAALEAEKYFRAVITAAQTVSDDGLEEQQYNLAKAYFLVSYFQNNKQNMLVQDDGVFHANEAAQAAGIYGIDGSGNIENPFYAFWVTNLELLDLLSADSEENISDTVKLESLRRLVYILQENYADFYSMTKDQEEKVDGAQMQTMYTKLYNAISSVRENEQNAAGKTQALQELEKIRPAIERIYDIQLSVGKGV